MIIFVPMNYELIDKETIAVIATKLKDLIPGFAGTIAMHISKDSAWKQYTGNKCSEQIVLNIARGNVKSQLHCRLFVKYAEIMLSPIIEQQNKFSKAAKKISKFATVR